MQKNPGLAAELFLLAEVKDQQCTNRPEETSNQRDNKTKFKHKLLNLLDDYSENFSLFKEQIPLIFLLIGVIFLLYFHFKKLL